MGNSVHQEFQRMHGSQTSLVHCHKRRHNKDEFNGDESNHGDKLESMLISPSLISYLYITDTFTHVSNFGFGCFGDPGGLR